MKEEAVLQQCERRGVKRDVGEKIGSSGVQQRERRGRIEFPVESGTAARPVM